jgi:hypothetical protein
LPCSTVINTARSSWFAIIRSNHLRRDLRSFFRRACTPFGQRLVGRFDRAPRLRGTEIRHRADELTGGRIEDLLHLAAGGAFPTAADERLLAKQRRVAQ